MRSRTRRGLRLLAGIALVFLGAVLTLEFVLRLAGAHYRASFLEAAGQEQAKIEGAVTILALGESTTGGLWLPVADSYPKQLERMLRAHYQTDRITVVVPLHIAQNTSQMVHRFDDYLHTFHPAVVLIMAGVNNTWSLAESNLGAYLPPDRLQTWLFRVRRWSDDIRVVRLGRLLVSGAGEEWNRLRSDLEGQPHMTQWPPPKGSLVRHIGPEPFLRLWRGDVGQMIERARSTGASVILMTYPNYDVPPVAEFEAMAERYAIPLVRNDLSFAPWIEQGRAREVFFEDLRHPNAAGYAIVAENAYRAVLASHALEDRLASR